eukprot:scaffold71438_cov64-Phaeocystis_antarctica.AAC.4
MGWLFLEDLVVLLEDWYSYSKKVHIVSFVAVRNIVSFVAVRNIVSFVAVQTSCRLLQCGTSTAILAQMNHSAKASRLGWSM